MIVETEPGLPGTGIVNNYWMRNCLDDIVLHINIVTIICPRTNITTLKVEPDRKE